MLMRTIRIWNFKIRPTDNEPERSEGSKGFDFETFVMNCTLKKSKRNY